MSNLNEVAVVVSRLANWYGNSWGLSSQLYYQAGERQLLVAISRLSDKGQKHS